MKKLLPILLLLLSLNVVAQKNNRERIKALKVSFITERLDFSEKEAQQFWPVYNDYEQKMSQIRHHEIKSIRKAIKENIETMSDDQAKEFIDRLNKAENDSHKLRMAFSNKLSSIISPKKIIQLKLAEDDFKRKMFEEYKKRNKEKD